MYEPFFNKIFFLSDPHLPSTRQNPHRSQLSSDSGPGVDIGMWWQAVLLGFAESRPGILAGWHPDPIHEDRDTVMWQK